MIKMETIIKDYKKLNNKNARAGISHFTFQLSNQKAYQVFAYYLIFVLGQGKLIITSIPKQNAFVLKTQKMLKY